MKSGSEKAAAAAEVKGKSERGSTSHFSSMSEEDFAVHCWK
jgi:hypothetical protein